jgi:DNA-binding NtrC family response regulator
MPFSEFQLMAHEQTPSATAQLPEDDDHQQIRSFRITVLDGPDAGRIYQSDGDRAVIGTHESADFSLTDRTVSRFHAELSVDDGGVSLRDLDSRNGTRVENLLIQSVRLDGPMLISFGKTQVRFELVSDKVAVPLAPGEQFHGMVGSSTAMRATFNLLERAATTRANILIEGEPGTGKGLAAAAIHDASDRSEGPFGVVDCSHPEDAVRRELFGTGGDDEPGALVMCDGGTLVLEDLGALAPPLQADLVRALDDGAVRAADGQKRAFDTRIIATTRRNLRRDVNTGRFKTGLYSIVAVLRVRLPPLRERPLDIPVLVATFVDQLGASRAPAASKLQSGASIEMLRDYTWPENVRELRTHVERCLAADEVVEPGDDPTSIELPGIDPGMPIREARAEWVQYFERRYLGELLDKTNQNVSAAARIAGVDRVHMHRLLKAHGLR